MADPFTVSLRTLIAVAPLLGYKLENRSVIADRQELDLLREFQAASTVGLSNPEQALLFLVAPLDLLCVQTGAMKQFHLAETNGTGIGGLTNMASDAVAAVLKGLTEMALAISESEAVVLVAVSGMESTKTPRLNKTIHEKVLYVEALKRGLEARGDGVAVAAMPDLAEQPEALDKGRPTVILGYMKQYLDQLGLSADGRLLLFGRPVTAAVNDRFCLNVFSRFADQVDLNLLATMNRCFLAGADKGVTYGLVNDYTRRMHPGPLFAERTDFVHAHNRGELVEAVLSWLRQGRRPVIKARGTGLGHGVEFFLDAAEPQDQIVARIDHSIRVTEHYYGLVGGAFPYTVCEFIDISSIDRPGHELHGHKYELRVVVYRDGQHLKAFPSIVKVSPKTGDTDSPARSSLITNISASAEKTGTEGTRHMLPLCNRETLDLLDLPKEQLCRVCSFCTGYVRFLLDRLQQTPDQFGLPARSWQEVLGPLARASRAGKPDLVRATP